MRVEDFGIRGVHLAYELLDGYDALVLVDASRRWASRRARVALLEIDVPIRSGARTDVATPVLEAHSMSPVVVLDMLAGLGGAVDRVCVVGCEPGTLDEGIGLSGARRGGGRPRRAWCDRRSRSSSSLSTPMRPPSL